MGLVHQLTKPLQIPYPDCAYGTYRSRILGYSVSGTFCVFFIHDYVFTAVESIHTQVTQVINICNHFQLFKGFLTFCMTNEILFMCVLIINHRIGQYDFRIIQIKRYIFVAIALWRQENTMASFTKHADSRVGDSAIRIRLLYPLLPADQGQILGTDFRQSEKLPEYEPRQYFQGSMRSETGMNRHRNVIQYIESA